MANNYYNNKGLRVAETNYDDMQGNVATAPTGAAQWATAQIGSTGFFINWLQAGQNDFFQIALQMTHRKKLGVNIQDFHVHYILSSIPVAGQTVKLNYAYTFIKMGAAVPVIGSWTASTKTITFLGTEAASTHYYSDVISNLTTPADETYSGILLIKVTRESQGVSADTYAGNFGLLYADSHILVDRAGSVSSGTD